MIKGKMLDIDNNWNCELYRINTYEKHIRIGIFRNKNLISRKYEVWQGLSVFRTYYFPTFKEAAVCFINLIKNDPKYIPDIMRVTALMSEEK